MYLLSYESPKPDDGSGTGSRCSAVLYPYYPEYLSEGNVYFSVTTEGHAIWKLWFDTDWSKDKSVTGVLCDWLQDHRDLLLSGAVGPNPAERLEQVIDWFRQHFERGSYATA